MLVLARWARRLSWKETAQAFRTSWEKVFDAVEYVVTWGLEHRTLGQIDAIGVDEIQYAKGHKYLTLVYQIDLGIIRLLWVGRSGPSNPSRDSLQPWAKRSFPRSGSSARTLPQADPREMLRSSAHPRPFPYRGQNEQSPR
jgi:hypothetical protein